MSTGQQYPPQAQTLGTNGCAFSECRDYGDPVGTPCGQCPPVPDLSELDQPYGDEEAERLRSGAQHDADWANGLLDRVREVVNDD